VVERTTLLWTLVVFFGASVLFGAIANATEGESAALRIGLEAIAGVALIGLLALIVRRTRE
jgi:MYXO-CTERM domain-containing protein